MTKPLDLKKLLSLATDADHLDRKPIAFERPYIAAALAHMRKGLPLSKACKAARVSVATFRTYNERYSFEGGVFRLRQRLVFSRFGKFFREIAVSKTYAEIIDRHHDAVAEALATGDQAPLAMYEHAKVYSLDGLEFVLEWELAEIKRNLATGKEAQQPRQKSPAKTEGLEIQSDFAIIDIKSPCDAVEKRLSKSGPIPVVIEGSIVAAWGDFDGASVEFELSVQNIKVAA
jgi:hypothetical protein